MKSIRFRPKLNCKSKVQKSDSKNVFNIENYRVLIMYIYILFTASNYLSGPHGPPAPLILAIIMYSTALPFVALLLLGENFMYTS